MVLVTYLATCLALKCASPGAKGGPGNASNGSRISPAEPQNKAELRLALPDQFTGGLLALEPIEGNRPQLR
jgi:hypothetical protein